MDKSQNHSIEQSSQIHENILYDSIYIRLKTSKAELEIRSVLACGCE